MDNNHHSIEGVDLNTSTADSTEIHRMNVNKVVTSVEYTTESHDMQTSTQYSSEYESTEHLTESRWTNAGRLIANTETHRENADESNGVIESKDRYESNVA